MLISVHTDDIVLLWTKFETFQEKYVISISVLEIKLYNYRDSRNKIHSFWRHE